MEKLFEESKRYKMEEAAVELFTYYRALVDAGFTKKQAMKVVLTVVGNKSDRR
jgi:hypothetical protein